MRSLGAPRPLSARIPHLSRHRPTFPLILQYQTFSINAARASVVESPQRSEQLTAEALPPKPEAPSSQSSQRRRRWRGVLYSLGFLTLGLAGGSVVAAILVPPPLPASGSVEDESLLSKLRKDLGELPVVKELRAHREQWLEYEAYMSQASEVKDSSMSAGAMRGFGGLGIQRVFWNNEERRLISVVFFGGALAGWPGVVHGGAIATVLHENLERVANGPEFGSGSGSADAMVLEQVKIEYRKPTQANAMFVVKAEAEGAIREAGYDNTHVKVKATLENAITGQLCAEASGYCAPKGTSTGHAKQEISTPRGGHFSLKGLLG